MLLPTLIRRIVFVLVASMVISSLYATCGFVDTLLVDSQSNVPADTDNPLLEVAAISADKLLLRDKADSDWQQSLLQFAEGFQVRAASDEYGLWELLEDDRIRWELYIYAPGATDVNIGITEIYLPVGCSLLIYNDDGTYQVWPIYPH